MAVFIINNPREYGGTNAERLAMSTVDVKPGASFYETDTKNIYIFNGSAWVLM